MVPAFMAGQPLGHWLASQRRTEVVLVPGPVHTHRVTVRPRPPRHAVAPVLPAPPGGSVGGAAEDPVRQHVRAPAQHPAGPPPGSGAPPSPSPASSSPEPTPEPSTTVPAPTPTPSTPAPPATSVPPATTVPPVITGPTESGATLPATAPPSVTFRLPFPGWGGTNRTWCPMLRRP